MKITEAFLQETLAEMKRDILESLHVAMPGMIMAYDAVTGLADVQPGLARRTGSGRTMAAPMLYRVPVIDCSDRMIAAGDPCILIFMDFCMDGWMQYGAAMTPASPRKHDLSDAVVIVGLRCAVPDSEVNS